MMSMMTEDSMLNSDEDKEEELNEEQTTELINHTVDKFMNNFLLELNIDTKTKEVLRMIKVDFKKIFE